ncbi:hypothetical protein ACFW88_31420 [Streptomyces anandii]|uniref:Uncharacterized protein n=1 Tax=Streptomyces anandii TaxID=285454 RepID=A0ABW6HED7_9ACTN
MTQQISAQRGGQNNACGNESNSGITVTGGGRYETRCADKDASRTSRSVVHNGDARAVDGDSASSWFAQTAAQSGRQNNACNNGNDVALTGAGNRVEGQCVAIDRSTNIGTVYS